MADMYRNYDKTKKISSHISEAYFARGVIYEVLGNHNNALSDYAIAFALDPKNGEILTRIGWMYFINNEIEGALMLYNRAIFLDPHNSEAYYKRSDRALEFRTPFYATDPTFSNSAGII